ncbi:Protein ABIL2 [Striga hermonthica]|uniref:Protein ABIL2 n=1 Tax=Striga hermonthica TaxID=68872 RepID=A0A9N7MQF1_STRHE|nr:Protein ABIL2 [Striga hermonthica]
MSGDYSTSTTFSVKASQMVPNSDEMFFLQSLSFQDSLKDLRTLRQQLYAAAEHFETFFDEDDSRQSVIESSKDYVAKALINTVDHLGSVADRLNSFLDEKTKELEATNNRFTCIQQKASTCRGFVELAGMSRHSMEIEAAKHHKQYTVETLHFGKPELMYKNCTQHDTFQPKQGKIFPKGHSWKPTSEFSPRAVGFAFHRFTSNKEPGKHSFSPLGFSLKRSGSIANRSVSSNPTSYKRSPSEPRRSLSLHVNREIANSGMETEPYTKRSKHMLKALLDVHRSRK